MIFDGDVEVKEDLRYEKARHYLLLPDIHDTAKRRSAENLLEPSKQSKTAEAEVIAGVNMEGPLIDPIKKARTVRQRRTSCGSER